MRSYGFLFAIACAVSGCGSDDPPGGGDTAPAAPTNLQVAELSGGAHLTWTDASNNEEMFMIMRKTGNGAYEDIDMVTFNTTQYHDTAVTAGTTYTYQVMAMNTKGAAESNEVTFTLP